MRLTGRHSAVDGTLQFVRFKVWYHLCEKTLSKKEEETSQSKNCVLMGRYSPETVRAVDGTLQCR